MRDKIKSFIENVVFTSIAGWILSLMLFVVVIVLFFVSEVQKDRIFTKETIRNTLLTEFTEDEVTRIMKGVDPFTEGTIILSNWSDNLTAVNINCLVETAVGGHYSVFSAAIRYDSIGSRWILDDWDWPGRNACMCADDICSCGCRVSNATAG